MTDNKYYGIYQGVVTNINDGEKRGRVKVKCPDVLGGDAESAWCSPVVPVSYDGGGDFCIPHVGETVWVMFIAGDANKPVWVGGWWSTGMTPLGDNYSDIDKVRIINYSNCMLVMRDECISISVGDSSSIDISNQGITIKGNFTLDESLSVNGNLTVNGDLNVSGNMMYKGELLETFIRRYTYG